MTYRTAGYCCKVQIFATLLKWLLAEISAIAKFSRHKANLHWILCQENAWAKFYSLENIRISLFQQKFCESNLHSQISQKFGPRTHNPLYGNLNVGDITYHIISTPRIQIMHFKKLPRNLYLTILQHILCNCGNNEELEKQGKSQKKCKPQTSQLLNCSCS